VTASSPSRTEAIDAVAETLLPRASLLTRLLLRAGDRTLSRTEAGLLGTLMEGPRRITELAETEAVAQPTVTQLVDKLQARGLVARERSPQDGRVVLVTATEAGRAQLTAVRAQYRDLMRDTVRELSDEELTTLVAASETLRRVIDAVQQRVEPR
jgi:DNA-binding MarR family transcriptional regulator